MNTSRSLMTVLLVSIIAASGLVTGNGVAVISSVVTAALCVVSEECLAIIKDSVEYGYGIRNKAYYIFRLAAPLSWVSAAIGIVSVIVGAV